ncbi:hypothetical protein EVAR_51770_1 [Eumeta japonica]|uniref:Uncharacterized protein n=1 Tax=Eumeta variegata TaxID=151549 RepID=A0A4C1XEY0_EUMVA|nr:hypothetical protein EVAR_51770_1 [Eumeta japonica]
MRGSTARRKTESGRARRAATSAPPAPPPRPLNSSPAFRDTFIRPGGRRMCSFIQAPIRHPDPESDPGYARDSNPDSDSPRILTSVPSSTPARLV